MFRHAAAVFAATVAFLGVQPAAQPVAPRTSLSQRIDAVLARPEFRHAMFGIELYSLDAGKPIYILNADKLFVPGSTTELVTMGSALQLLGADRRFHTRVYRGRDRRRRRARRRPRAGGERRHEPVGAFTPGDTLAFENVDHPYGGPDSRAVDGDPLRVVREIAASIAARGVKRVDGRVVVDASLFAEGQRDGGTRFVIPPMVNPP